MNILVSAGLILAQAAQPPVYRPIPVHQIIAVPALPDTKETMAYKEVPGWHIRIDLTLDGGCFANAVYDDYTYLRFAFAPSQKKVFVMLGNKVWRSLEEGSSRNIIMQFDRNPPWQADAQVSIKGDIRYLTFTVPDADFLREVRSSSAMSVRADGRAVGSFSLLNSTQAIESVAACQAMVEHAVDPFAKK